MRTDEDKRATIIHERIVYISDYFTVSGIARIFGYLEFNGGYPE